MLLLIEVANRQLMQPLQRGIHLNTGDGFSLSHGMGEGTLPLACLPLEGYFGVLVAVAFGGTITMNSPRRFFDQAASL